MSDERLTDEDWTLRCTLRLLALDPALQPVHVEPIVADLCSRARWRAMTPEIAAQTLFDYGGKG